MDENTWVLDGQNGRHNPFSEKAVRNGFVRKVYTLLTLQLLITVGVCALFIFVPEVQQYALTHPSLLWAAIISYLVLAIALSCCQSFQRKWPWNLLALFALTLALSYLVAVIANNYAPQSVLAALVITVVCCVAVSVFAINTSYDFTSCYGTLFLLSLFLLLWGLLFMPFFQMEVMQKVYAGLGAGLFMLYLAADTQMIMGRKQLAISAEDYVVATLMIYLDLINIFLFILALMGQSK